MKWLICNSLILLFLCLTNTYGQGINIISTSTEETPDSTIFNNCIDSIKKYVYLDSRKIKPFSLLCKELINSSAEITERQKLNYVIQSIYNEFNYADYLGIAKLIVENRYLLDKDGVARSQKVQFNYLDGYTSMMLGDLENAQLRFYDMHQTAKVENDTSLLIQALGSLGALFTKSKDYSSAENYFLEYKKLIPKNRPNLRLSVYVNLLDLYIEEEDSVKAQKYTQIGLKLADSLNSKDLKIELLIDEVKINIANGLYGRAEDRYLELEKLAKAMANESYIQNAQLVYSDLLIAQNKYNDALDILEELIEVEKARRSGLTRLSDYYSLASVAASGKKDYKTELKYLKLKNTVNDSLAFNEQKQKSAYLKIKFNADEKDKENALLNASVEQKKLQNKFLVTVILFSLLASMLLAYFYFQNRKFNKRLKEKVKMRTSELQRSNKQLEILNQELNDFNNILSHDLKEPLRSIVGFSSLVQKEITNQSDGKVNQYLEYITKSGKQMHQLIEDVNQFQNVDAASVQETEQVDINSLLNNIAKVSHDLIKKRNAIIKYNNLPIVYNSQSILFLAFKNIIENGIKFNNSSQPIIEISHERGDDFIHFFISDNGIGIAPKFHQAVFNMFERLNDRSLFEGSGLGLSMVKKLLTRIDGSLSIHNSELGKGTTFKMSIPVG